MVIRTRAWNLREYGQDKMPRYLERAREMMDAGERNFARLVRGTQEAMVGRHGAEPVEVTLEGRRVSIPKAIAWHGGHALFANMAVACARPDTDLVVDLGSGWGRSLFEFYLWGGPRNAAYVGLELTEAGRACAETLAGAEPDLNLVSLPFDFEEPDFSAVPRGKAHAVIMSDFSLTVVPRIPRALIEDTLALAPDVTGVHIEVIGFQADGVFAAKDREGSSAAHAAKHDYNTDLWAVLRALESDGRIRIESFDAELVGINPVNALSVVTWRKVA